MTTERQKCCLCGMELTDFGNNPAPLVEEDMEHRCCNECNNTLVIPARLYNVSKGRDSHQIMTKEMKKNFISFIDNRS